MTGFSADWLALRAPADAAARDEGLLGDAAAIAGEGLIADIGGGTGATFRALSPLAPKATWRVLDADGALLAQLPRDERISGVEVNLSSDLSPIFEGEPRLVTASAFFDLASRDWIDAFAARLAASGAALYAALTYDGRQAWEPRPPGEDGALSLFHEDMRRDKGFGPALGPGAHAALVDALRRRGYEVSEAESDWRLTSPDFGELIEALAQGGGDALESQLPYRICQDWIDSRKAASCVLVGHMDLLATPPAPNSGA
ncbi:MAG: class I SAM-dependent methyltransferase [Pseudomonadota bacterium]